eukprot:m.97117 g.97117  ORF g.97117 m.97117 type:complete len:72 (-) comp13093_c1_seq4:2337-2552(-)
MADRAYTQPQLIGVPMPMGAPVAAVPVGVQSFAPVQYVQQAVPQFMQPMVQIPPGMPLCQSRIFTAAVLKR